MPGVFVTDHAAHRWAERIAPGGHREAEQAFRDAKPMGKGLLKRLSRSRHVFLLRTRRDATETLFVNRALDVVFVARSDVGGWRVVTCYQLSRLLVAAELRKTHGA